jgi:hypothetical protein
MMMINDDDYYYSLFLLNFIVEVIFQNKKNQKPKQ